MASEPRSARERRAEATPEHIVRSAERLFARNGLDEVSVRDITREAEVSISSVYHHFGSKENLIVEILRRRVSELKAERARLIETMREPLTARQAVSLLVLPTAAIAADHDGGGADYIRFVGAVTAHQKYAPLIREIFPFADEERRMLARAAPHLSADEREFRFALIKTVVNLAFGERGTGLRIWMGDSLGQDEDERSMADRLIEVFTAAFTAPGRVESG